MARDHLEDLLTDVSFVRWIRGEASPGERSKWNRWLKRDPEHQRLVKEATEIHIALQKEGDNIPDISTEWQKLEGSLDREEQRFKHNHKKRDQQLHWKSRSLMVTALLIIGICVGAYVVFQYQNFEQSQDSELAANLSTTQEYQTDYGEKATFRLSDNSRIVLNANSRIRFSSNANGEHNSTEVWLQGEAWFDITHLEGERRRTFTVRTDDGDIQVIGTRFVVKTFEKGTRAVLEEGEIHLRIPHQESGQVDNVILEPGEMALFSSEDEGVTMEKVNPMIYTSWREDIWFFDDTPLDEIGRRIEDTFGLTVLIQDDLTQRKLSGSIKGTSVDVLSKALSKILDVEIEQQDQALYIGKNKISQ